MIPWIPPSPLPAPITTDRTLIRQYRRGDGPALFAAVNAARDRVLPWLPWLKTEHQHIDDTIFFVEKTIRATASADCTNFPFGIFDKDDRELLGGVGFHRIDAKFSCGDIGYWIRGDRHGEGLCPEAVSWVMTSGFTDPREGGWGFRRITLTCAADNRASSLIAEKLGLRLERRERAERFDPPSWRDLLGYAVLKDEWDSASHHAKPDISWPD